MVCASVGSALMADVALGGSFSKHLARASFTKEKKKNQHRSASHDPPNFKQQSDVKFSGNHLSVLTHFLWNRIGLNLVTCEKS